MVEKNNNYILKLPKTTLILMGVALVLVGGIAIQEIQRQNQPTVTKTASIQKHFTFADNAIQSITLVHQGQNLKLYRGSDKASQWKMDSPKPVEVSEPAVTFLINLFLDSQSDRDFETNLERLQEYGLVQPQATITVQLKNGKTHTLFLGNPDFKGDSLYALIDAPSPLVNPVKISLVSRAFQEMIKRSPQEWKKVDDQPSPAIISPNAPVPKTED